MSKLIYNELYKVYKQKLWIIFPMFVLLFCIIYAKSDIALKWEYEEDADWKQQLENELEINRTKLKNQDFEYTGEAAVLENDNFIMKLQIENNIPYSDWRMDLIYEYMSCKDEGDTEKAEHLLEEIQKNDWKKHYQRIYDENIELLSLYSADDYEYFAASSLCEEASMRLNYGIAPDGEWRDRSVIDYFSNKNTLYNEEWDSEFQKDYEEIEILERNNTILYYSICNNIKPNDEVSYGMFLKAIVDYKIIVIIAAVFFSISCVCQEYQLGTLKHLFTYSKSRKKILWSKYFAMGILTIVFCTMMYFISAIVGRVMYGQEINKAVIVLGDYITSTNYFVYIGVKYILVAVEASIFICMTMFFGIIVENIALCLGIMLGSILGIPILARYLFTAHRMGWVGYIPTLSFDWNQFLEGVPCIYGMTVKTAVIISIISVSICILSTHLIFEREDVN